MRNYEVNFIVDSVLSGDEINATAQTYFDMLTSNDCTIVDKGEMGLRQLAYPINTRSTGVYYCTEFQVKNGSLIAEMELAMRRDERIMRFLTVSLNKYGVKFNEDKRNGLIGKKREKVKEEIKVEVKKAKRKTMRERSSNVSAVTAPRAAVEARENATVKKEEEE